MTPKSMTLKSIDRNWNRLQTSQRLEVAESVARSCIGHDAKEVAEYLGESVGWVTAQLDLAAMARACGGKNT